MTTTNLFKSLYYSLKSLGIVKIRGKKNTIKIPFGCLMKGGKIKISGKENLLYIEEKSRLNKSYIFLTGEKSTIKIGRECLLKNLTINIASGLENRLSIGSNTTFEGGSLNVADNTYLDIGNNCMCSWLVDIFSSDMHSIISDGIRVNHGKNTYIGDNVWISAKSTVLKGAIIKNNCVIAASSVVIAGEYPANSLLSGVPAKIKRNNISWLKERMNDK